MNQITQMKKGSQQKASTTEGIEEIQQQVTMGPGAGEDMDEYERGVKMIEDAMGPPSDNDEDNFDPKLERDENEIDDDYYNQVKKLSRQQKQKRKEMFAVEPKYPFLDTEVEGMSFFLYFFSTIVIFGFITIFFVYPSYS